LNSAARAKVDYRDRTSRKLPQQNRRCLDGSGNLKEGMAVRLARFS
jgi:hypothetical protein